MNIEIRNLKIAPALSEETTAYTATVYVDGVATFAASNHGHGGGDFYQSLPTAAVTLAQVDAWLAVNGPSCDFGDCDLEWFVVCHIEQVELAAEQKKIRAKFDRILTKSIAALRGNDLVTYKAPPTAENIAKLRAAKPDVVVLNDADAATRERGLFAFCPNYCG